MEGSCETHLIEIENRIYVRIGYWTFNSIPEAHQFLADGGDSKNLPKSWTVTKQYTFLAKKEEPQ